MIITVGGTAGSGKSMLANRLAERLGLRHVSAGEIMREMALERGMSINEFSKFAEEHPDVDAEVDERQIQAAKSDCVVDGRLSAYKLHADVKIWLDAPIEERARRVLGRDSFKHVDEAVESIREREASERKRYQNIYGIDLDDLSVYDLVLNTGLLSEDDVVDVVVHFIKVSMS